MSAAGEGGSSQAAPGSAGGAGASSVVGRVDTSTAGGSGSGLGSTGSQGRPSSPAPTLSDMFCPIAENWCYTQASAYGRCLFFVYHHCGKDDTAGMRFSRTVFFLSLVRRGQNIVALALVLYGL